MAAGQGRKALSRRRLAYAAAFGLVLVHLTLAALLFDPKPFTHGDSAGYVILSEAIETGQGYRDIYLPHAPRHALYPPFYPAVLALAATLGGGLLTYKVFSVAFSAAAVISTIVLARSRMGWPGAFAVGVPFALSPVLLDYSHWVLPEALFLLLLLVSLWAAERDPEGRGWIALAAAVALLAFLTRAGGLAVLIALLLALAWRRRWRVLSIVGVVTLVVVVGYRVWASLATAQYVPPQANNFLLVDPSLPQTGYVGPGQLVARAVDNLRLYVAIVLPESLTGQAPGGSLGLLALLTGLVGIALALVGWVREVRRMRPLECFTLLYLALILLWPRSWTDGRALLPLIPMFLLHTAAGLGWLLALSPRRTHVWALPLLGAVLALLAVPGHVRSAATNHRCLNFYRLGDRLACYPTPWRAFAQAAFWVRDNTPQDAIVVSERPRLFYLFSERRGNGYPRTSEDEEMLSYLDEVGADYVVVGGPGPATVRYLMPVILSMPERFQLRYRVPDPSAPAFVLGYQPAATVGAGR